MAPEDVAVTDSKGMPEPDAEAGGDVADGVRRELFDGSREPVFDGA